MKYQLANIHSDGVTLEGTLEECRLETQPGGIEPADASSPFQITYSIHLNRSGTTVFIKGMVTADVALTCSRCLEPFSFPLTSEFSFSLVPEVPETKPSEKELQPEELEIEFYDGETVDVGRILQNNVLLAIPIKPLCRDDCGGFCAACGANKNLESCTCSTEKPTDPRLAGLKNLLK